MDEDRSSCLQYIAVRHPAMVGNAPKQTDPSLGGRQHRGAHGERLYLQIPKLQLSTEHGHWAGGRLLPVPIE